MARSFSYTGGGTVYTSYCGHSRGFIRIGNVSFDESAGKIIITWDLGFACDSGATGAFVAAAAPYFGGVIFDYEKSYDNGGIYYGSYMVHPRGTVSSQQGSRLYSAGSWSGMNTWLSNRTHIIDATNAISYGVRAQMMYGWGWVERWESSGKFENVHGGVLNFKLPQYDIIYDTNGGSAAPETQIKDYNTTLTLTSSIPTKNSTTQNGYTISFNSNGGSAVDNITVADTLSYTFNNWNTSADGSGISYEAGSSYTTNVGTTLYAQYNITTSGGSIILPTCNKEDYTFVGWSDGTNVYTGSYTPTNDIELTAVWAINPPSNLDVNWRSTTTTEINLIVYVREGIVDSAAVLYREQGDTNWTIENAKPNATYTIKNLKPDTNYEIGVSATNSGYTVYLGDTQDLSQMTYITCSTRLPYPVSDIIVQELTPFTATITVIASTDPERPLSYRFTLDSGITSTEEQYNNTYTFTGLKEETQYSLGVIITAYAVGINNGKLSKYDSAVVITPPDQARAKIKTNGKWENSKMYIKKNGEWTKIKKMYIKKNGQWVRVKN